MAKSLPELAPHKEQLDAEFAKLQRKQDLALVPAAALLEENAKQWKAWLSEYTQALGAAMDAVIPADCSEPAAVLSHAAEWALAREAQQRATNPRRILRNYLAEWAIQGAANGDASRVQALQEALGDPYDLNNGTPDPADVMAGVHPQAAQLNAVAQGHALDMVPLWPAQPQTAEACPRPGAPLPDDAVHPSFDARPPAWSHGLCVTCSS